MRFQRIEGTVGVETCTSKGQTQAFHVLESRLQMRFEVEGVMMLTRYDLGRSDDKAVDSGDSGDMLSFLRDFVAAVTAGTSLCVFKPQNATKWRWGHERCPDMISPPETAVTPVVKGLMRLDDFYKPLRMRPC